MFQQLKVLVILQLVNLVVGGPLVNCTSHPKSSYCLTDVAKKSIIPNEAEKETILNMHNQYRKDVKPFASKMMKMYWDDDLAAVALKWAKHCEFEHDTHEARIVRGYYGVGQNVLAGNSKPSWATVVNEWHKEIKDFEYGKATKKMVGHYTQEIYWDSSRIGCGAGYCPNSKYKYIYVCNYFEGQYNVVKPYPTKPDLVKLADCPKIRKDGLCDCGGKACRNGGQLDLTSCKCICARFGSGETCEKETCKSDRYFCQFYKDEYCDIKYNLQMAKHCPHKCGLCKN
ncbi:cysteine-rich venom protein Mr30-like [Argonauta hians]